MSAGLSGYYMIKRSRHIVYHAGIVSVVPVLEGLNREGERHWHGSLHGAPLSWTWLGCKEVQITDKAYMLEKST